MTGNKRASTSLAPKRIRKDAERNRALVLGAAARLFAERGIETAYEDIAREAGVGVGTVYRRFPDRGALIAELIDSRYNATLSRLERSLDEDDPDQLLESFCVRFVEAAAVDTGFREATFEHAEGDPLKEFHTRVAELFAEVVARARAADAVRPDMTAEDLAVVTILLSWLQNDADTQRIPRYVSLVLDGIRPAHPERGPLPGRGPTPEEVLAIVQRVL